MKHCLEKFITNCDKGLLQIATGKLLQIATSFITVATGITNCDSCYYKLRQVLQIATLLQIATVHRLIIYLLFSMINMIKLQCTIQFLSFLGATTVTVSVAQVCIHPHRLVKDLLLLSHHFVDDLTLRPPRFNIANCFRHFTRIKLPKLKTYTLYCTCDRVFSSELAAT